MTEQLSLSELHDKSDNKYFQKNIKDAGFDYQKIDIGDVTFKAGQIEPIHRWYRLTPSYSPGLVEFLIKEFQITEDHFVVDPFSGRGTTSIECQKHGISTLGIEINPLLKEVGNKSLEWDIVYINLFDQYLKEISQYIKNFHNKSIEDTVKIFNTRIPIIYNVFRWWKRDILKNLIICREIAFQQKYSNIYNYLWIAINKACLDCANIHRNHPTITFDDNHNRTIDVFLEVKENLEHIHNDLSCLSSKEISFTKLGSIILGDSINNLEKQINKRVNFIITSPPYPNRYSYVHQTRPQLHFMEILDNISQATEIDLQAVGGTWGRATSILKKDLIEVPHEIKPYLCYYEKLKHTNILMCNYATKYFINMWKHIKSLKKITENNFKGAYVVGNSRLAGEEIFTETILASLFRHEGFEVEKIVSFRKRGGKKRLYETAICIRD